MSGLFLVFEGGEGTGKSTQIKAIKEILESESRKVLLSWEPGGSRLGESIRKLLLDPANTNMSSRCEALLYAAARAQHVEEVLRPAYEAGAVILCDRYWDASRAYQGVARSLGIRSIDGINEWATQGFYPDRVYFFDIPAVVGLERARESAKNKEFGGSLDRIESENTSFHEKVRDAYAYLAKTNPRARLIDASQSVEKIRQILLADIKNLLDD